MMPLIELEITDLTRRRRSLPLPHRSTRLSGPLAAGTTVVVRDVGRDEFYSGRVCDADGTGGGLTYRLGLGIRLPEEIALDRVRGFVRPQREQGLRELLHLLGKVREEPEASC